MDEQIKEEEKASNMEIKTRTAKIFYFFFAISFFVSAVVTCGIVLTVLLVLWPFSKPMYRRLSKYLGYTMFAQAVFMLRYWSTTDMKLYVDKDVYNNHLGKEHSLCIMNHSGELDWIVISALLDRFNILGNIKAYMKNAIKFIPFVGWGFYCCEFIYLSRSYEKDKKILKRSAQEYSEFVEPITILLFPEGTRFSPKKHEEALQFCRERGLKELHHHLVPRTKGFTTSVPFMKGKIPAIYDLEVAFDGVAPTIANMMKPRRFNVHAYLRRIPMEEVPDTEAEQDQYLRDMFYQKDACMDSFRKTGDFFKLTNLKPLEPITIEPTDRCFYNMLLWLFITLSAIIYYLVTLLISGQYLYFCMFVAFIAFSFRVLAKSIDTMVVKDLKRNNNMDGGTKVKSS